MNAISFRKLVLPVIDPEVLIISDVHQSVIASPSIGVDNARHVDFPLHNALERLFSAVRNDLGIYSAIPLEETKDRLFQGAATTLQLASETALPSRSEVRLVCLDLTHKLLEFLHLMPVDRQPEMQVETIDGFPIESQKFVGLCCCQVETEALQNFFNMVFGYFRLFNHISRLNHLAVMV